ncbi:hypothetical protein Hypma_009264 [Hypsizygus marmoreus]|uniref:Uncharacterized protein n=1 Tax=Hypsizygus marmoreus TaxID=39966 RepID=A0A369JQP2_HYPMA|nr:hypothetical protein Hypma_009264 [Hypsizygus marmoreus]
MQEGWVIGDMSGLDVENSEDLRKGQMQSAGAVWFDGPQSAGASTQLPQSPKIRFTLPQRPSCAVESKLTMIIDEKVIMQPPPPYFSSPGPPPFPGSSSRPRATLTTLPSHILLQIVYATFPQTDSADQDKVERQRKTLYWLSVSLRLVNRVLYVACMHVLRSTHLPAYDRLIRPPYSSDPFPLLAPQNDAPPPTPSSPYTPSASSSSRTQQSPLNTIQRETATLDLFIALKVREDVWADDSELHLERDESFKDLFDLVQPRSRLEDLVRIYGLREGVITIAGTSKKKPSSTRLGAPSPKSSSSSSSKPPTPVPVPAPVPAPPSISTSFFSSLTFSKRSSKKATPASSPAPSPAPPKITPIPFHMLSVSFSPRHVGIVLQPSKRTVVSTVRARDERLEVAAKRLVRELRAWLVEGG